MRIAILALLIVCSGCVSMVHAKPTTAPATEPVIKLSDAVDLDTLAGDREPNLSHQLHLSRGGRIFFGTLDTYDNDDKLVACLPIFARKNGAHWVALPLTDSRLKNASWAYVAAGPQRGEVWGILDACLEDDQPDLLVAHSTDSGATFSISAVHKPDESADFDSFCIGPDQRGRITIYLSADNAGKGKGHKPGYYHFRTADGGATWSTPEYEPDAMSPAHDVPEEDQPDLSHQPAHKA
jgi:hypothetical protein